MRLEAVALAIRTLWELSGWLVGGLALLGVLLYGALFVWLWWEERP